MRSLLLVIAACCFMTGCATPASLWRNAASSSVEELGRHEAAKLFPQEYYNLLETFEHGEALLHVHANYKEADALYLLTLQKGDILRIELQRSKERKAAAEAEKAIRAEEARLAREAAEAEVRLAELERIKSEAQARARAAAARARQAALEPPVYMPSVYTVRRGETLPQIAARTEIYDDASLWPIIYRANRDQIRNPRQLWPGQKLKIPRNFSRDDITEAKRYSGRK